MTDERSDEKSHHDKGFRWRDLPELFEAVVATARAIWLIVRGLWLLAGLIAEAIRN